MSVQGPIGKGGRSGKDGRPGPRVCVAVHLEETKRLILSCFNRAGMVQRGLMAVMVTQGEM